jgi:PAS domain S-box-containing protein
MPTEAKVYDDDFRELYEHAPCGYLLTREDGLIIQANATFLSWLGFTHHQLIQKQRFQDLLTIPGKIYYETHFAPLLKMQGAVSEIAFDLRCENRPPLPVLVTSVLRQNNEDEPNHYRTTLFDATARRHYERELLQKKRKLERLNDEKNELLGMAAHELRTPLGVISTYSEFLEDEVSPQLAQEYRDFISLIRSTSDYMLRLVNDILDVSQIDAGKLHLDLQATDLHLLVEQTVAINRRLADKKQIRARFKTRSRKCWIIC